MAKSATIFAASQQPLTLALLVLPQSSILEVASTLDPLRSANRHLGHEAYRWRVVSPDGKPVPLTCGIELPSSGTLAAAEGADALILIVGYRQSEVAARPFLRELRRLAPRFKLIAGVDAGAWVMARAGLLDGYRATVHWEDLEDFAAAHPGVDVQPSRFVLDRNRFTAGGAAPATDLMLHLIACRHGAPLARQVAQSFLTTTRDGHEPQIAPPSRDPRLDPRVADAVARMEARLDTPEPAAATARAGRVLFAGVPTGLAVTAAQQHGGPWPASTAPMTTSVGDAALARFLRPVSLQDAPAWLLARSGRPC